MNLRNFNVIINPIQTYPNLSKPIPSISFAKLTINPYKPPFIRKKSK